MAIDSGALIKAPNPITEYIEQVEAEIAAAETCPLLSPPPEREFNFGLVKVDAPPIAKIALPGVGEVRDLIRREMAAYLKDPEPDYMLLIRATPGVGKTTAAAWAALEMAKLGKRTQYAGPRHAFFNDLMRAIDHWGGEMDTLWEWLPRQDGDGGRIQFGPKRRTCQHCDTINAWMRKGYKGMDFCSGVCGWDYINDACEYHAQRGRKEPIIFCQHAHIAMGHPLEFHVAIGDENPMGSFTYIRTIQAGDIIGDCPSGKFRQLLSALTALAAQDSLDGPEMIKALLKQSGFGLPELIDICTKASMPLGATPAGMDKPHTPEDALSAPVWFTPDLIFLLLRELTALKNDKAQVPRIRTGYNKLNLYLRRSVNDRVPKHLIWLDATANSRIYEALFQRKVKLVSAEPGLAGRVFQVWNRANGKGSLLNTEMVSDDNGGTVKQVNVTDKAAQANQLIERIIKDWEYRTPAIISFKDLAQQWEFTKRVEGGHFYAARGSNAFENCDAIFIVGAPLPTLAAMKRTAGMIFFERNAAFNDAWTRQNVRYNYTDDDGDGWAYPIGNFWADPDLAAVVTAYREEEIIHAANRVRPVFQNTDVWLLTNIPISALPPHKLLSMAEIFGAPDNSHAWKWGAALGEIEKWSDDVVTTTMLVKRLKMNRRTATKYIKHLMTTEGWEAAAVRTGKRGPMTKGAKRK